MKKFSYLSLIAIATLFFFSCEGPEGPPGLAGVDGTNGVNGADGNAVCLDCHNKTTMGSVETNYEMSGHAAGTTLAYAGGRASCARCHSGTGFIEFMETGTVAADIDNPRTIDCEACHDFHESLDFENEPNYALRSVEAVTLIIDDTKSVDFGGSANLCANCHQPRTAAPVDDGAGNFRIGSSHYGPHHGPQSTVLAGIGLYKFAGVTYPEPTHYGVASCTTCHMHGDPASHTFEPKADACAACHDGATSFDIAGKQTEIEGLMTTLEDKLANFGLIYHEDGEWHINTGTYTIDQAGAFYNFAAVFDDRSKGVHNYPYVKAALDASIAALP
jgi:hypothetical protein